MAMLIRYKKPGGFLQLLQLLETCTEQKKETLLKTIEKEDKRWADKIREKMLTLDEIFKWDKVLLGEIFQNIQELTLAVALHQFSDEQKELALHTFSHIRRRNITDLSATKTPSAAEIHTAISKIIEETRHLSQMGKIKLKELAPHLYVEDDIESQIDASPLEFSSSEDNPFEESQIDLSTLRFELPTKKSTHPEEGAPPSTAQLTLLKNEIQRLKKENLALKKEINDFRIKLSQVKKIVAA